MASITTERAVSISRGDSTDNLLSADLSPPEVLLEPTVAGGEVLEESGQGASSQRSIQGAASSKNLSASSVAGATAAARPLLTAPSFDQRPTPDLADASPWSSTETSCRSRKNSVNLLDCWNQGGTSNSNNNNTLSINQRLGDVAVRTAPPSQSSVDSAIISTAAGIIAGCGGQTSRNNRSVPDIELHYRRGNSDERVCGSVSGEPSPRLYNRHGQQHHSQSSFSPHYHQHSPSPQPTHPAHGAYQHCHQHGGSGGGREQGHHHSSRYHPLHPQASHPSGAVITSSRPRVCEHQPFSFSLSRATSRESVRSAVQSGFYGQQESSLRLPSQLVPELAASPASSGSVGGGWSGLRGEMLRQHSQPETSCYHCHNPSASLRQLKESSGGSGGGGGGCDIAGIAADTLRINGAIRQFRQVAFPVGHSFSNLSASVCHFVSSLTFFLSIPSSSNFFTSDFFVSMLIRISDKQKLSCRPSVFISKFFFFSRPRNQSPRRLIPFGRPVIHFFLPPPIFFSFFFVFKTN